MRLKAPVTALLLLSEGLALIGPYLVNSFIYYLSFFRTGGSVCNMLAPKQNCSAKMNLGNAAKMDNDTRTLQTKVFLD